MGEFPLSKVGVLVDHPNMGEFKVESSTRVLETLACSPIAGV